MVNEILDLTTQTTEELVQRKLYILEAMDVVSTIVACELAGLYEEILAVLASRGYQQKSRLVT